MQIMDQSILERLKGKQINGEEFYRCAHGKKASEQYLPTQKRWLTLSSGIVRLRPPVLR